MLKLVCLDFDGTIMSYDETGEYFHPEVIGLLEELGRRGIGWCTNSGRDVDSQRRILETSRARGLSRMPDALLCSESMVYRRRNGGYVPDESWNAFAYRRLLAIQAEAQRLLVPRLPGWLERYPVRVTMGEYWTVFQFSPPSSPLRSFHGELCEALAPVAGARAQVNGDWVSILPQELGKGNILRRYLLTAGVPAREVLSVGDHHNDIPMLDGTAANHVGCPSNAISEVTEVVRCAGGYVASSEGPMGTVEVIRHFLEIGESPISPASF